MIPNWLDVDTLRWVIPLVMLVILVAMFVVARFVTKIVTKAVLLSVLALFGLTLWIQRADLGDCAETCKCRLYGQEVEIPDDKNRRCAQN